MSTRTSAALAGLTLVLLASPAEAQRRILSRPWPTAPAPRTSDAVADAAPIRPAPSERLGVAPVAEAPAPEAIPPTQTLQLFGRTDLRVSLPQGWPEGVADESRLPAYAQYTFTAGAGAFSGAVLRVERVVGLNPAEEQQWRGGQTPYGYHGARPVGALAHAGDVLVAFETAGPGVKGASAFAQRGRTFWAVSVVAPEAIWAARRDEVVALLSLVTIPAGAPVPGVVATPRR